MLLRYDRSDSWTEKWKNTQNFQRFVDVPHSLSHINHSGHTSFVNDVIWGSGGNQIISAGSDGSVRVWDTATTVNKFIP